MLYSDFFNINNQGLNNQGLNNQRNINQENNQIIERNNQIIERNNNQENNQQNNQQNVQVRIQIGDNQHLYPYDYINNRFYVDYDHNNNIPDLIMINYIDYLLMGFNFKLEYGKFINLIFYNPDTADIIFSHYDVNNITLSSEQILENYLQKDNYILRTKFKINKTTKENKIYFILYINKASSYSDNRYLRLNNNNLGEIFCTFQSQRYYPIYYNMNMLIYSLNVDYKQIHKVKKKEYKIYLNNNPSVKERIYSEEIMKNKDFMYNIITFPFLYYTEKQENRLYIDKYRPVTINKIIFFTKQINPKRMIMARNLHEHIKLGPNLQINDKEKNKEKSRENNKKILEKIFLFLMKI